MSWFNARLDSQTLEIFCNRLLVEPTPHVEALSKGFSEEKNSI